MFFGGVATNAYLNCGYYSKNSKKKKKKVALLIYVTEVLSESRNYSSVSCRPVMQMCCYFERLS